MMRSLLLNILFLCFVLCSCTGHSHSGDPATGTDSLSVQVYDARYKSVALTDSLAKALDSLSADNEELVMVATNAMAYSALMKMDYATATALYDKVLAESDCEIEKLVADVGLMTICYRVSGNRQFFDCRARALERMRRIDEDVELLSVSDKARFERAKIEFGIVSICYFSNLSMLDDVKRALGYLGSGLNKINDPALKVYARMLLANTKSDVMERLDRLSRGLSEAGNREYTWLTANYKLLLAIVLRDNKDVLVSLPDNMTHLLLQSGSLEILPYALALSASDDFKSYGDKYMMVEAMAVSASCQTQLGNYDKALQLLDSALYEINGYYSTYYPAEVDFASNVLEECDIEIEPSMFSDSGMYNIPECLLSVRREASCAYAGLGDKYSSDINRESYLQLLRTTRLNKKIESSVSSVTADIRVLDEWLVIAVVAIVVLISVAVYFNYRKRKYENSYSNELKRLPDICRQLLSSLPQDVGSKEELCAHIVALLNNSFTDFSGSVRFAFEPDDDNGANRYSFAMRYIGGGADCLYVSTALPLTPEKLSLLEMLVPYVAVAIGEGMRLADIGDEQVRLEEMRQACAVYLAEHKRENLLKRVSVSTVMSMRPFIDRIINELRALKVAEGDDVERKLEYVTELTEKLDDLNVILERWIKMRQGDMNLLVESFRIESLFAIIEKSRQLLESRGITLRVGETSSVVKADKVLTLFMINTLVDNAAKFTPKGGSVALECTEGDDYVEVAVTDTGVGISQSDIDRILNEKVYDASNIGSDNENLPAKSKGGGFGLMNCKGIIEKYRKTDALFSVCSMNIESSKGRGSRFSFRLPKGVMRCILLLLMLLPCRAFAGSGIFEEVRFYADSVYSCNTNGNYDEAFVQARNAFDLLNSYYLSQIVGNDTLVMLGDGYAELKWWREGLFPEQLTEGIFYNILDIRNELAVASLAKQDWQSYRYNNYIYSTLYRLVDEDKGVAEQYEHAREALNIRRALIGLSCFLLLLLLLSLFISYLRHAVIGKANEHLVQSTNLRLLELVASSSKSTSQDLLQGIVDEIYSSLGERMCINRVALLLSDERLAAAAPERLAAGRADVYLHGVIDDGEPFISSDALLRVLPLYATVLGDEILVGAIEFVTERPLSENETVNVELVARFVASVAYHRTVRVANSYMTLEEVEEETERIRYEENRLHVQNMVMDNCLSVIKHETIYYPNRVRELAQKALVNDGERNSNIAAMGELMDYYNSVFGILSNCAKRELDTMCFNISLIRVGQLFDDAKRYAERCAKKRGVNLALVYETTDSCVKVDTDLVSYLFEVLVDAAFKVEKEGTLLLRATDTGDVVRVELVDNRRTLPSEEVVEMFTPSRYNIGARNGLSGMEYLIAKEIVRMHEDYTGRHGSRMEARSDVDGVVILFTLPK
ncbi:MAG: DUF5113 domain-containing protein [Bacteroidaceae bacterium]|nr:DUF5113 domain-containing protein [Bacteroidaceae bacterium]